MKRIRKAYETRYLALLKELRARQPEKGLRLLMNKVERLHEENGMSVSHALIAVQDHLRHQVEQWKRRTGRPVQPLYHDGTPPRFVCDVGLGGLTRWLRAAGYEAEWLHDADDSDLILEAASRGAVLLTTDSLMMERRVLRDGEVPSVWVPPTLKMAEQLDLVLRELRLPLRESRCMKCGGELVEVDKASVLERIPPKTAIWQDDYFLCSSCGKLFWHGTHWRRIQRRLKDGGEGSCGERP